jgi:hypothetical protein
MHISAERPTIHSCLDLFHPSKKLLALEAQVPFSQEHKESVNLNLNFYC